MAEIAPLTPLRYNTNKLPGGLPSVVAPPYDVIDAAGRADLAARDPHNVVKLILPEGEGDAKYGAAAELLAAWRKSGALVRDDQPAFYVYEQTFQPPGGGPERTRRGFLGLVKLVPFSDRVVLPHERTLSGPKEDRLKLFRATKTNLSPGFMLYRDPERKLDSVLSTGETIADFKTADGIRHVVRKVSAPDALRTIVAGVAKSSLLIADGHHRYETALRYSQEVSEANPAAPARAAHRYFMTFLANEDDPNLLVYPTHRHVHSLPSFSFDKLLEGAAATFDRLDLPGDLAAEAILAALEKAGRTGPSVAAAAPGRVAILTLKGGVDLPTHPTLGQTPEVLRRTDVAVLHAGILEHLLGITKEAQAAKTSLWYPQNAAESLASVRGGKGNVLFLMNATPVAEVRRVAEAGEVMPQKSTFFYPKVLTGLTIHTLEPDRVIPET